MSVLYPAWQKILVNLIDNPAVSASSLGRRIDREEVSTRKALKYLREQGLVKATQVNGRQQRLDLTDKGYNYARLLRDITEEVHNENNQI